MKGTSITADDLRSLQVKTFSPAMQGFYVFVGLAFIVFGVWVHMETRSMALSFVPVLLGIGNIGFATHGRPKRVGDLGEDIPLMELTAEIVKQFVSEMDAQHSDGGDSANKQA